MGAHARRPRPRRHQAGPMTAGRAGAVGATRPADPKLGAASGASVPAWPMRRSPRSGPRGLVHFHAIVRLDRAQDRAAAPGAAISPEEPCCKSSHEQITTRDVDPARWRDRGIPEQLVQMSAGACVSVSAPDSASSPDGCTCSASAATSSPSPGVLIRRSGSYEPPASPPAPAKTKSAVRSEVADMIGCRFSKCSDG
jgi:hypothetical protein